MSPSPNGYRPCAGAVLFNADGHVFMGRRADQEPDAEFAWQLPQGGIDPGEAPEAAARRELWEETGVRSVTLLAEAPDWLTYDFPPTVRGKKFNKYKGQAQRWFAYRFDGTADEVDLEAAGHAEFSTWDWRPLKDIPCLIVPFKRPVYEAIVLAFQPIASGSGARKG